MILEILVSLGSAVCVFGPGMYQDYRYSKLPADPSPQEFSSRQVKLVAELLKERAGWSNLEKGMDPIHESGVRYFPCNNQYGFYSIMNDYGVWETATELTPYDRKELQRLYNALAKEVKNERQSELTRTLARRVVSGERIEAEPAGAQLDTEYVKSLGFNPLAGTKWEDTYASAGVSAYNSAGRLMLTAGILSDGERRELALSYGLNERPNPPENQVIQM